MNKILLVSTWLALTATAFSQPKIVYTDKLPSGLKSVKKEGEVEVVFKNNSQEFITVAWVRSNGDILIGTSQIAENRTGIQYVAPGNKGVSGKSSVGYAHVIMAATGKILGYFVFENAGKFEVGIEPPSNPQQNP
jgi:hypothetical protein